MEPNQLYFYVSYFYSVIDGDNYTLAAGGNGPATFAHVPPTIRDIHDMQNLILEDLKKAIPNVGQVVLTGWQVIQIDESEDEGDVEIKSESEEAEVVELESDEVSEEFDKAEEK